MIINIRGTSGSGKSHLVRSIMGYYGQRFRVMEAGRRQPIGYVLHRDERDDRLLSVIGHYETPCGGCDTIPNMEKIFQLVRKAHEGGFDVVFEGLLISADIERTSALYSEGLPLHVVGLDTPLEECLDSVNERRKARLGEKFTPVNPKNTESKYKGVRGSMAKLASRGVRCTWASREAALDIIKEDLKL